MCGSQSETGIPLWPAGRNVRRLASKALFETPIGVIGRRMLAGNGCPASSFTLGLGSKVSS